LRAEKEIERPLDRREQDRNFCPVAVPHAFVMIGEVVIFRHLFRLIRPVVLHVLETGEMVIGADKTKVIGGIEYDPTVTGLHFDEIMGRVDTGGFHLGDAYGIMKGLEYAGEDGGIAATGAFGGHEINGSGLKKIRLGACHRLGITEHEGPVAHQKVAGMHRLDHDGILGIVGVDLVVDIIFYGKEKTSLVRSLHFEITEGSE
jgi:hypothetical protein